MNRQGNVPSRGLAGYPSQTQQARNAQIPGAGRIPNARMLPNQPQWGYGPGVATGLPNPQSRAPGMATSFAQTIGGNHSSTPLDPSEFPSLSGGSQPQLQNHNQAFWSGQRQHTPVQRPQASQSGNQQGNNPDHGGQSIEDAFFPSIGGASLDDFRHGGQNGVGQLSSSNQPQTGNIDDFPPLGGGNGPGEIGQDRRANLMQSAANSAFAGSIGFPPGTGSARAAGEALRNNSRPTPNGTDNSLFSSMNDVVAQRTLGRGNTQSEGAPSGLQSQEPLNLDDPSSHERRSPSQMTDAEKYGLPGLLDNIRNENNENFNLAIGHDLTVLGLDLNSSEPLHPTFGGPFATRAARPLEPDYVLPPCYTVTNVPQINEKLPHFSDETLFLIFYTMCGDLLQELAAIELTLRNWRFHKSGGFWMTKEQGYPEPTPISPEAERGHYVVFDQALWARKSHEMTLRYAELDDHITNAPQSSLPFQP